jgi:hypothetical protein
MMMSVAALAQGNPYPSDAAVSDQKAGSILIYNYYTSTATPAANNTRINITNTNPSSAAFVHLFFVAAACDVADSFICLTANQTATFLTSDIDPATTGYIVAVAVDGDGCKRNFNYLIGDEYVKFTSGNFSHAANLGAEAIAAINFNQQSDEWGNPKPLCTDFTTTLSFNGTEYDALPRVLAVDSIPSRGDGNDTIVVVNSIRGNLATGVSGVGTVFGLLYDDAESVFSFATSVGCQKAIALTNTGLRTTPRIETVIPAGRTGWMKLFSQDDRAILGAELNANPNTNSASGAFAGGHNLHKLTLTTAGSLTMPVFPPSC